MKTISAEWHCPNVENDLRPGRKYSARMEAKVGSFGFDFEATYDKVFEQKQLTYTMSDGRQANTHFESLNSMTKIATTFDDESQNPIKEQRSGWQANLVNVKQYLESNKACKWTDAGFTFNFA